MCINLNSPMLPLDRSILYLKIFLLGGVTWILEVLSFVFKEHKPSTWVWLVGDFFNCLHGVLIFIVLVLWRQRIRKELAGKKLCNCYTFPSKWADIDDDEICLDDEEEGEEFPLFSFNLLILIFSQYV